jgi:hypothetical protein
MTIVFCLLPSPSLKIRSGRLNAIALRGSGVLDANKRSAAVGRWGAGPRGALETARDRVDRAPAIAQCARCPGAWAPAAHSPRCAQAARGRAPATPTVKSAAVRWRPRFGCGADSGAGALRPQKFRARCARGRRPSLSAAGVGDRRRGSARLRGGARQPGRQLRARGSKRRSTPAPRADAG